MLALNLYHIIPILYPNLPPDECLCFHRTCGPQFLSVSGFQQTRPKENVEAPEI